VVAGAKTCWVDHAFDAAKDIVAGANVIVLVKDAGLALAAAAEASNLDPTPMPVPAENQSRFLGLSGKQDCRTYSHAEPAPCLTRGAWQQVNRYTVPGICPESLIMNQTHC